MKLQANTLGRGLYFARNLIRHGDKKYPVHRSPSGTPFVFIHINKTGGTSVDKALGIPAKDHRTVREVQRSIGRDKWTDAYSFAFVRNPYDKVVSHFHYRVRTGRIEGTGESDFANWVERAYGPDPDLSIRIPEKMFLPQMEWLAGEDGHRAVDFIGRFETLDADFATVADRLGFRGRTLPVLNVTANRRPTRDYFDRRSAAIVTTHFARDFENFGYERLAY